MSPLGLAPAISYPRISPAVALVQLLFWCTLAANVSTFAETLPPPPHPSSQTPEQIADCHKAAREPLFQDLPNSARYGPANTTLPPLKPGERRVVFMGD